LELDFGQLRAEGKNTLDAQSSALTWFALGASGRLEWLLAKWAALEFEAGIVVPTRRDRFLFEPDLVVHELNSLGLSMSFGGIARF
jgi:hypothetical protein